MATTVSMRQGERTMTAKGSKRAGKRAAPSEEDIRVHAYQLYERRRADGVEGDAASDWIEAERELTQ